MMWTWVYYIQTTEDIVILLSRPGSPIVKDERFVSKMECKTSFSRRLKQFDGLTLAHYFTTDLHL